MRPVLIGVAVAGGLVLGPWSAARTLRSASGDAAATPTPARVVGTSLLLALGLGGAAALLGARPALVGVGWLAAAAVVLGGVDLLVHRLPDRVTYPAVVVLLGSLLADGAVTGGWAGVGRSAAAGAVALVGSGALRLAAPQALGLGDVKLLGLLGLVLGWRGWDVLLTGVFLGLLAGAALSLVLIAARRAGWRTAIPFGPPLLVGAAVAFALAGSVPG